VLKITTTNTESTETEVWVPVKRLCNQRRTTIPFRGVGWKLTPFETVATQTSYVVGLDIVCSAWEHAAVHKRTRE